MSGRHRTYGHIGRGRLRIPVALGVVSALFVVTAVTVRIVSASAAGCSGSLSLRVAATPEIALVLEEIGSDWMATKPQVAGECVDLSIQSIGAPKVASMLTVYAGSGIDVAAAPEPTPAEDALPAVWVPDSTAWLLRVQTVDRAAFAPHVGSVASSPVVIAMPDAAAATMGWPDRRLPVASVKALLDEGELRLGIAEPRRETASLAATIMLGEAMATTDEDLPLLVRTFRGVVKTSSTGELLQTFGSEIDAGPASEQAVLTYNAGKPTVPLAPVQVDPYAPQLDYPYAIRSSLSREATEAAEMFRSAVLSPRGAATLARKAFRAPDGTAGPGFPSPTATSPAVYPGTPVDQPERIQRALGLWSAANSPSRTLALFDVTSSMRATLRTDRGTATRSEVMVRAATEGIGMFTRESRVGMWVFGETPRQVLSISPLDTDQQRAFGQRLAQARPGSSNKSELYRTLLAAYKTMKDGYDATRPNLIVVLTDGGDSDKSDLRLAQFNQDLQQLADPTKPIRVVLIGIGVGADDEKNLQAIAQLVGGGYFPLTSPDQIRTIFLRALLRVGAA